MLLVGCKSVQPTVNVPRNDSVVVRELVKYNYRTVHDSVYIRESSDTIRLEHWHTEYKDSIVLKTDTLYRDKEIIKQLPPERYIPPWAWWTLGFSILMALLTVARIILRIYLRR